MSDIIGKNGKIFAVSKQINNSLENLSKIKKKYCFIGSRQKSKPRPFDH